MGKVKNRGRKKSISKGMLVEQGDGCSPEEQPIKSIRTQGGVPREGWDVSVSQNSLICPIFHNCLVFFFAISPPLYSNPHPSSPGQGIIWANQ